MVEVSEVNSREAFSQLREAWDDLFDRSESATLFQSWPWVSSWLEHDPRTQPLVLLAKEGGAIVGILPLAIDRLSGLPISRVRFAGAPLIDYGDLIAAQAHSAVCARAFLTHLGRPCPRWDLVDLADLRAGSPLVLGRANDCHVDLMSHRLCPSIRLPSTWEAYRSTLSRKLRSSLGRQGRRLTRMGARIEEVHGDAVPQTMEELYRLHNHRWRSRGLPGAFASDRIQRFHHLLAPALDQRGWLRLLRLVHGDRTQAVLYGFGTKKRFYYYLSGFDAELARHGPGNQLIARAISLAISEGMEEFDFLRGNEHYKYNWKAQDHSTVRLVLSRSTLRSLVGHGLIRGESRLDQLGTRLRNELWGTKPTAERT